MLDSHTDRLRGLSVESNKLLHMGAPKLSAVRVSKSFPEANGLREVLNCVNANFRAGKSYSITGASGCGKSTLLHILAGVDDPTRGEVCLDGENIFSMTSQERRGLLSKVFGLVFQDPYLVRELTILENVMIRGLASGMAGSKCRRASMELLDRVGLGDRAMCYPTVLSGGEKQRVSIARAILGRPAFLLADEPTGSLDEETGEAIVELLLENIQLGQFGLIVVTHDQSVVSRMDSRMILRDGNLVEA